MAGACHERSIVRRIPHVIALSDYVREALRSWTDSRVFVVSCGVDDRFFRVPESSGQVNLLYIGGIERRKGVHDLILAFARVMDEIPDCILRVGGRIRSVRYAREVKEMVRRNRMEARVEFLGELSEGELLKAYERTPIFVFPSHEESFGLAPLEAMATGRAVISTESGAIGTVMEHGESGLLVGKGDVDGMSQAIYSLVTDAQLRSRLSRNARKAARRYTWERVGQQTADVYEAILAPNGVA